MKCTKCNIHWKVLKSQNEGDEVGPDVCPQCGSDSFLKEMKRPGPYIFIELTGQVINPRTGKGPKKKAVPPPPVVKKKRVYEETKDEFTEKNHQELMDYLERYMKFRETMSHEEADKAAKLRLSKRKFHLEPVNK